MSCRPQGNLDKRSRKPRGLPSQHLSSRGYTSEVHMHVNWGKSVDLMEGGDGAVQGLAGR